MASNTYSQILEIIRIVAMVSHLPFLSNCWTVSWQSRVNKNEKEEKSNYA